jgi:uncharacterized protein (TIGR03435 family)
MTNHSLRAFLTAVLLLSSLHLAPAQTAPLAFEVASVRPAPPTADPSTSHWSPPGTGRFTATHVSLALLLQLAYGINPAQIVNKPAWLETDLYDIDARPEDGIHLTRDQLKPCLQDLLRQRFHLVAHMETRPGRGYALLAAKGGPHLIPTKAARFPGFRIHVGGGEMRGDNWSIPQLAKYLASVAGFPVVDRTDITGNYDIAFNYNPQPDADSPLPPLEVALKDAIGLLLKPQTIPVEVLVVDSIDKTPTAN